MAFIYRSDKTASYIPKSNETGPGQYQINVDQRKQNFISNVGRKDQKIQITPGPGQYNAWDPLDGQKVIFQSAENEIKILEIPKPLSIFNSTTMRQKITQNEDVPGPGSYNIVEVNNTQTNQRNFKRKKNILEDLMKINKYQSIPSIPGKLQKFGYNENENNELNINHNNEIMYKGTADDMVGPGSYEQVQIRRQRAISWKNHSEIKKNNDSLVGPGSYDINENPPFHKFKGSSVFKSKSVRGSDKRKGMLVQQFMKDRLKKQERSFQSSMYDGTATKAQSSDEDENSEYEFIEDDTPGPGSYPNASTVSTISSQMKKNVKNNNFGSQCERFCEYGVSKGINIGPGYYIIPQPNKINQNNQNIPFLSKRQRFEKQKKNQIPGPTYYDTRQTIENQLIQNLQNAPLGSFGVNEERFKDAHLKKNAQIAPGMYDIKQPEFYKPKQSSAFKMSSNRIIFDNKIQGPAPGTYDQQANTIELKCKKDEEDDPELAIDRPGFGVGAARWKQTKIIEEDEEEDDYEISQKRSVRDLFRRQPQNLPPFNSRTRRFNYSVDSKPGPGEYHDGINPQWNKRTFNIIFADI